MFRSKRVAPVMNISRNSFVHARQQLLKAHHHNNNSYVARFSSIFDQKKGGTTTPDKLSSKDSTIEGSEGGYGGSGISDIQGLHGGSGTPNRHDNKATPPTSNKRDQRKTNDEERYDNLEDAARDTAGSVAEMAKSGVVGAVETGLKLGDMAKKTMDTMYHTAKKTTESVRDSMANDRTKDRSKGL